MGAIYMVLGLAVMVPMVFLTEELLAYLSVSAQISAREVETAAASAIVGKLSAGHPLGLLGGILLPAAEDEEPGEKVFRYLWIPGFPQRAGKSLEQPGILIRVSSSAPGSQEIEACRQAVRRLGIGELMASGGPAAVLPSPFANTSRPDCGNFSPIKYDPSDLQYCIIPDLNILKPSSGNGWQWRWGEGAPKSALDQIDLRCYGNPGASMALYKSASGS